MKKRNRRSRKSVIQGGVFRVVDSLQELDHAKSFVTGLSLGDFVCGFYSQTAASI